jgi:DNA-binding MarR family transcriptional regulator
MMRKGTAMGKGTTVANNSIKVLALSDHWIGTVNKMEALEKLPGDFGSGDYLNRSEIHTIMAIGMHKEINITDLARCQKISKSATSRMVDKLSENGLVEKYHTPDNDKETLLRLTQRGKIAYLGHEQYHAKFDEQMLNNIGSLSDDEIETIKKFLGAIEATIDVYLY